jgi:hypothetical protein
MLGYDVLFQIMIYLSCKDLLSSSMVCKDWNKVSQDNQLWFIVLKRDLSKKIKNRRITYSEDLIYKSLYLSCFNHHYQRGRMKDYKELYFRSRYYLGTCLTIVLLPIMVAIEIYDFYGSKQNRYEYCNCESCEQRSRIILEKVL